MAGQKQERRPLVAGNWKMNGLKGSLSEITAIRDALSGPLAAVAADVLIAPPATVIASFAAAVAGTRLALGAQDCHAKPLGAHTGDISAEMLKDAGASAVIVGHSERRADHGETSAEVRAKAAAAHRAGLVAIVCIGETQGERAAGATLSVVSRQLKASLPKEINGANTVIAYEPVWAIGTGLIPTASDVEAVHAAIRQDLKDIAGAEGSSIRILYGGSVKPDNAATLLSVANVDGALVGGASLKASDFLAIVRAYEGK
ncbi:triose-phosphate isomerase [Hyphomicrobium sp.]|jgi:triosephosphate isomerase|uniref:triose-phosphate isomerase n=1 Tax=Hyphomicrobium sp. TaxID=82 RepID=UPI002BEACF4A|nr:triose-phosphate isomerase [Hyphomicrobium sp.]HVZ03727.1 triose-phosphate isomerase [Hyphomicrobium sp.]